MRSVHADDLRDAEGGDGVSIYDRDLSDKITDWAMAVFTSALAFLFVCIVIVVIVSAIVGKGQTEARLDRIERALSLEPRGAGEER